MSFKQGDIVWIDYQFIEKEGSKKRPCVIISNANSNSLDKDYLICPITTNQRLDQFSVLLERNHLSRSLPKSCEIRANKVFTYRESNIIEKHAEIIVADKLQEIVEKVSRAIAIL